jgi:hypothetical protein
VFGGLLLTQVTQGIWRNEHVEHRELKEQQMPQQLLGEKVRIKTTGTMGENSTFTGVRCMQLSTCNSRVKTEVKSLSRILCDEIMW